jgi:hypothetical protein
MNFFTRTNLWLFLIGVSCLWERAACFYNKQNKIVSGFPVSDEIYPLRMRSSLVVRASDRQCSSFNGPGFAPSIRRLSGIWEAAGEAVLNTVRKEIFKKRISSVLCPPPPTPLSLLPIFRLWVLDRRDLLPPWSIVPYGESCRRGGLTIVSPY